MKKITFFLFSLVLLLLSISRVSAVEVNLKFSGGWGYFNLKDINRPLPDWVEWKKKDTEAHGGWTFLGGEAANIHTGFDFQGELILSITSRIAVAVGAGYFYTELNEEKTELTIERIAGTFLDVKPIKVSALPLTLLGYYFLPVGNGMRLYGKGGAGLVWGKYIDREGRRLTTNKNFSYQAFQRTSGEGSIVLGGLGFEYEFEPGMRVFIEASGRLCKISDFEGENDQGETGTLYSFEEYDQNYQFWQVKNQVKAAEPTGANFRSVQKTVVDISGFSMKIGLLFKF